MRQSLFDYCCLHGLQYLLNEWDTERNGELLTQTVSYGSRKKVWWKCNLGHYWETAVYSRTEKQTGCPYCTRKKIWPGDDLASTHPYLAAQWHPTKNQGLKPDQFSSGSHRSVWWLCERGHEWRAVIKSRVSGCGCPVCANRVVVQGENDLASTYPKLAVQWHPTRNGSLRPSDVVSGTNRKSWWICEKGHEWQATVSSRVRGSNCPVCNGKIVIAGENDLASYSPALAQQWIFDKNLPLTPEKVTAFSNHKVWWRCQLGHEWMAVISSRAERGTGCPYCSGKKVLKGFNDLETLYPEIAKQWHPTLNGRLTPDQVTSGSNKKVWWKCSEGHVWNAVIYSRTTARTGCPVCAGQVNTVKLTRYAELEAEAQLRRSVAAKD